jgi:hypothetical protein
MTTADEIMNLLEHRWHREQSINEYRALRYAVGMLNEIYLHGQADGETHGQSDESSIAEVALEGIRKRLTGEEK